MNVLRLLDIFWKRDRLQEVEKVFFGLGNPGRGYKSTRHNIGFAVIDALAKSLTDTHRIAACRSKIITGRLTSGRKVALVKPETYVNRAGEAFKLLLEKAGIPRASCVAIVDDFNLSAGKLRLRRNGSHGGHNGLNSIIRSVGSDFVRLRIGIGPLPSGVSVIDFVLGNFSHTEKDVMREGVMKAVAALSYLAENGIDAAMNEFN